MNSELRPTAVKFVKWGNYFVIRTLGKVDSAGRMALVTGTTFVQQTGL